MSRLKGADLGIAMPTTASLGAPKITVGSGLPLIAGRIAGDLHYDQSTGKTSVVTGVAGATISDAFNRTSFGTVADTGQTWSKSGTPALSGNRLVGGTPYNGIAYDLGATLKTSGGFIQYDFVADSVATSPSFGAYLGASFTTGGGFNGTNGWSFIVQAGGNVTVTDAAGAVKVNQASGHPLGTVHTWALEVVGTSYKLSRDGTIVASGTGAAMAGSTFAGLDANNGTTVYADNFSAGVYGSLVWQFSEPIYLQAQVISGAATVTNNLLKPGLRVPTAGSLRQMVLRCETAPVGAALTITCERFNNGASQGVIATASIPDGLTVGSVTGLSASLAQGDVLKFHCTAIGSTTAGADVSVSLDVY